MLVALAAVACTAPPAQPAPVPTAAPLFTRLGCSDCHAVSALGVSATHDVAPDLTFAYADVVTRYGMSLEAFLANPSGVMRLMLGAHLELTVADRDSVVAVLKALYHQRHADATRDAPRPAEARP
jgi:hypothetical protein